MPQPVHRARSADHGASRDGGAVWAITLKLIRDADDEPQTFRLVSILLVIASVLYIVPQIYALESADQVDALNGFGGLGWIPGALSAANPDAATVSDFAWPILVISLLLFAVTAGLLFVRFIARIGTANEAGTDELAGSTAETPPRSLPNPVTCRPRAAATLRDRGGTVLAMEQMLVDTGSPAAVCCRPRRDLASLCPARRSTFFGRSCFRQMSDDQRPRFSQPPAAVARAHGRRGRGRSMPFVT